MQVDGVDGVGLEPMRSEKILELLYRVLLEPAPEQIKSYFDVIEAGFLAEGEILFQSRAVAGAGFIIRGLHKQHSFLPISADGEFDDGVGLGAAVDGLEQLHGLAAVPSIHQGFSVGLHGVEKVLDLLLMVVVHGVHAVEEVAVALLPVLQLVGLASTVHRSL